MGVSDNQEQIQKRKRAKWPHIVFLALAVGATLALATWQWGRFQSGSGTFQNLGYALQWPAFGIFFIYAYRKYLQYENEVIDAHNARIAKDTATSDDAEAASNTSNTVGLDALYERDRLAFGEVSDATPDGPQEIDADFIPDRPEVDVATFNEMNRPRRGGHDLSGLASPRSRRR